jgi:hypothetical protein
LKIDVEGFEEAVLRGASQLMVEKSRSPRAIFIEVHPSAWASYGFSDTMLLTLMNEFGYQVFDVAGNVVDHILNYGEIIGRRYVLNNPGEA